MESEYVEPSLKTEGFIHCSTLKQMVDTANIFFKGQHGFVLLGNYENKLHVEYKYENPVDGGQHD